MKKIIASVVALILAVMGVTTYGGVVRADDAEQVVNGDSLKLSPSGTYLSLTGGETLEGAMDGCTKTYGLGCEVTVENAGTQAFTYKVYITPYIVSGADNNLSFSDENGGTAYTQISRWIKVMNAAGEWADEAVFTIKPGEAQTIKYKVAVPENVPGGSQYAVLWAQILNDKEEAGIQTIGQVGSVISGRAVGNSYTTAKVSNVKIDHFSLGGTLNASADIENTGNTDFPVYYSYVARTFFGKEVYRKELQEAAYPEITYHLEATWEDAPMLGIFQVEFKIDGADQSITKSGVVIIMPLVVLILLILLLTIVIVWIIIIIRKRKERKARKMV